MAGAQDVAVSTEREAGWCFHQTENTFFGKSFLPPFGSFLGLCF
jgi:hypothetical protein